MIGDLQMLHKSNDNKNCHSLGNNFEALESEPFTVKNGFSTVVFLKPFKH